MSLKMQTNWTPQVGVYSEPVKAVPPGMLFFHVMNIGLALQLRRLGKNPDEYEMPYGINLLCRHMSYYNAHLTLWVCNE